MRGNSAAQSRKITALLCAGCRGRLGIALDVITFVSDVVIAWALYELLRSVDQSLALLGAFLRASPTAPFLPSSR